MVHISGKDSKTGPFRFKNRLFNERGWLSMFFKKKEAPKFTHYMSLFWKPSEEIVRFEAFFNLLQKYDLRIVDMNLITHSVDEQRVGIRNRITFMVEGTLENLKKFEDACIGAEGLERFGDDD